MKTNLEKHISHSPYRYIFNEYGVTDFSIGLCIDHAMSKVTDFIDLRIAQLAENDTVEEIRLRQGWMLYNERIAMDRFINNHPFNVM